jgi:hypothetical protein
MTLGYAADDAVARVIAERIALNAREAGLTLQTVSGTKADIGLRRIEAVSSNPRIALWASAVSLGLSAPNYAGTSIDDVFVAESALLRGKKIIPLFQLSVSYAISQSVQGWKMGRDGSWHLADVWLGGTP